MVAEIEPNNNQAQNLGGLLSNTSNNVIGNVSSTDRIDNFKFTTFDTNNFSASLTGLGRNANLHLYQDINKDGIAQENEKLVSSTNSGTTAEFISRRLNKGDYIAQVEYGDTASFTSYNLTLSATRVAKRVVVTVEQATAISQFDTSNPFGNSERADFYTKITTNNGATNTSNTFDNNNNPAMNFSATQVINAGSSDLIPIKIELLDSDGGPLNSDDRADISPISGKKDLEFTYNTQTGFFFNGGVPVTFKGNTATVEGNGDGNRARVRIRVDHIDL